MNLSAPFIARPIATTLLAIGMAMAGTAAFFLLPVSSLPQISFPTIIVQATLPGASPSTMASAVATPLERRLGRIAGITEMTSSSGLGSTRVVIQFDLSRDINGAANDVQAAINASLSDLPTNLDGNPTYKKVNPSEAPIMIMTLTSDTYSVGDMYDTASTVLAQRLSQVDGIGQVQVGGSSLPAIRIEVNPTALNSYGISLEQVAQAVQTTNANGPKGQLIIGNKSSNIVTNDQLYELDDYKKLIITYNNGAPVKISDIADVVESVENVDNLGIANNKQAVVMILSREPGANVIETVERVKEILPYLEASIPAKMNLKVMLDRTVTIRAALHEVEKTLIFAVILVIGVIYIFLGSIRASFIPSVAIALSLLGTFGIMYLCGFSLDNLSLMALTIVTGFVVDDAIVVLENITRHIEAGLKPMHAALLGAGEVGFTVLSMSVSLVAVFIPILLMGGLVGRLFREFAITLSISIFVSMLVSLTLTPMLCSIILRKKVVKENKADHNKLVQAASNAYAKSLAWALNKTRLMQFITFAAIVLTIVLYIFVPKGFFPQQDTGQIMCSIQSDQDMSFHEIKNKLIGYIKIATEDPAVQNAAGYANSSASSSNSGFMFITLKDLDVRKVSADKVIDRLRKKMEVVPGAKLYMQSAQDLVVGGRQGNAQFQYTLSADSLDELNLWTPKVMAAISKIPGIADVNSDQRDRALQSYIEVDRDKAAYLGISMEDVDAALGNAFGQNQIATLFKAMNQYHVIMTVADQYWQNPEVLNQIYVPSSRTSKQIPLASFATFSVSTMLLSVNHQGQFPAATLSFNLLDGVALGDAVTKVEKVMKGIGLPTTIQATFQGTTKVFQESLASQPYLILAALLTVYIVLGILYENAIHPITILSTLPSAGVGALLSLLITGTQLTVIALIGIILLIGIVKKNAIMMIDFAINLQHNEHKSPRDAIYTAALLRFRPIMMTTMAALFAAIPLVVSRGISYELRLPLGISIMGGLILSQALTLYTTPVIYLTLDQLSTWIKSMPIWQVKKHHAKAFN